MRRIFTTRRWFLLIGLGTALLVTSGIFGLSVGRVFQSKAAAAAQYRTSWIGNSSGTGDTKSVQNWIHDMFVNADGTVYTNSNWSEAGNEAGFYKDGAVLGGAEGTHGWGRSGGNGVVADGQYLYITMNQGGCDGGNSNLNSNGQRQYPDCGTDWHAVGRYTLDGKTASFAGGYGWQGSLMIVNTGGSELSGLAINGTELFVSDPGESKIKVYNTENMTLLRSWDVSRPGKLAVDATGAVWVIQKGDANNTPRLLRYAANGQLQEQGINYENGELPEDISVDKDGRLLVADNGPDQNVKIYTNITSQPELNSTLGVKGGIFSGTAGEVGPLRFHNLHGVGSDANGNIYVGMGDPESGTELESYTPAGERNWRLLGLEFVDNGEIDPQDESSVYTKHEHFELDYSKEKGGEWSYKGFTLNPFKYPDDPRLHTSPTNAFVRYINGQKFLFMTDMYSSFLQIYRFKPDTDGEIAIPSGYITKAKVQGNWPAGHPDTDQWIWRDKNGDGKFQADEYDAYNGDNLYTWGWSIDSAGTIFKGMQEQGIRQFPVQGLDEYGNPIYTSASSVLIPRPEQLGGVQRVIYFPESDTMYLAGQAPDNKLSGAVDWGWPLKVVRYDNWSKGNRTPKWELNLPVDSSGDPNHPIVPQSISIAGDYLFTVDWKNAKVRTYTLENGQFVSEINPGPEVDERSGWVDIPYGISAYKRGNGEYAIFVEEDGGAKIMFYRWNP